MKNIRLLGAVLIFTIAIAIGMQVASAQEPVPESAAPAPLPPTMSEPPPDPPPSEPTPPSTKGSEPPKSESTSVVETYVPISKKVEDPKMVLHTSMGTIRIRLYTDHAPNNVRAVTSLARGEREFFDSKTSKRTRRPFYNGLTFHRVLAGYLVQTGCPFGNGRGGPGFQTADEISPSLKFSAPGMVAMAAQRTEAESKKDTNGSQFFITLAPMPQWDGKYTIIGIVESGMDVVRKIGQVKTGPTDRPIKRVDIQSVDILDPSGLITRTQSR